VLLVAGGDLVTSRDWSFGGYKVHGILEFGIEGGEASLPRFHRGRGSFEGLVMRQIGCATAFRVRSRLYSMD
jgi:hypothetical protein